MPAQPSKKAPRYTEPVFFENSATRVGILALQGDYSAHQKIFESLGIQTTLVKTPQALDEIDGLLLPGGESTVMSRLCDRYGITLPLKGAIENGLPVLGTCAGLIFLARRITGGSTNFEQKTLEVLDVEVARNAYGAQIESFEAAIEVPVIGQSVVAVFIRAPLILQIGEGVEILARHENAPVLVRQQNVVALSFHPEIAGETRIHQMWLDIVEGERRKRAGATP